MRIAGTFLLICASVLACPADVLADVPPWGNYQADPAHTGHMPVSLNPADFALRWSVPVGSSHSLNPVTAAEGLVFVTKRIYFDEVDTAFALNAETGAIVWSKNFGDIHSVNPPAYAYGNVYFQTGNHDNDSYLRAYNAQSGEFVFRSPYSAQWDRYYAPTIKDGKVYVGGGYYGGMYRFDAYSGQQNWWTDLNGYDQWTPAVDHKYAYAYIGRSSGSVSSAGLHVVNRDTGAEVSFIEDTDFDWYGWSMNQAPVIGNNDNVLVIQDSRLVSFDLSTEQIGWQLSRSFTGQPSVANGVVYALDSGALTAWDEATGAFLWGWEAPGGANLTGTFIVTDSHIFTRSSSMTYAVDLATHDDVWSYAQGGNLTLSEDVLYITGSAGHLTAISVPEPGSMLLMLGAAGVLVLRRRG